MADTAKRALQTDESRLRVVVDTAVDGVILIDALGAVQMFNPACERLFGYHAAEVIGHNVKLLMPAPFRHEHNRYLENYRTTGRRKIIGIGREVSGRRKDGSVFPMDLSVGEAKQDGETVFVGIIHDLTERKHVEQALRESAAQLRAVVDTAVDGVILIDALGTVRMFNPACERLFGYSIDEIIGSNVKHLMPQQFSSEHDGYLDNYRRTGERQIIGIGREVIGQRKDGTTFPMDLSVGEAKQQGGSVFVGVIHDLTERKRTEAQLIQAQKMEAVGQLSGGIAHDFNNLLTVIVGNAAALSELLTQPQVKRLADEIGSAADRGAELTRRLLAFSRRQTLIPNKIDCNRLIEGMRQLLRRALREDIEISTTLEKRLPATYADPIQLESAILNLALNAQDAMPKGGTLSLSTAAVTFDVEDQHLHSDVKPGRHVLVAVTDNGSGMPREVLERVFEPFFTTKEFGKGSGLGLSMVYGFVKQSSGHVTIYSDPSLGTTVRIYLPAVAEDATPLVEAPPIQAHAASARELVLAVEDDRFVREYAVNSLTSLGYRVIAAENGRDALARLAENPGIQVLFTDIVMPGGLSGWELAEQALKLKPDLKVLLASGYALDPAAAQEKLQRGLMLLHKPYRKADLGSRLRELLELPQPESAGR